ncbi:adenosylcobinamide-GDP ribazoletransferase [Roseibium sp. HPY-6]|uniref:adenosylcobinamide-GDP ribazoletransferase n=1 Tax=Roseibium sp. HPY-6 TaxID=3229852 RepID=UPI00338F1CD4
MSPETDQYPVSRREPSPKAAKPGSGDASDRVRLFAADAAAWIRFFSRLPLPRVNPLDDPAAAPQFERSARAAPFAGFVVALPAAGLGMLLAYTSLPTLAVAAFAVALLAATTGALHEDGLSDVADGFFGGATRDRRLEIMKDSRIGSFGALALALSVLLRVVLLAALWQRFDPADAALLFLATESISRTLLVWQWYQHPLARPQGLAARFGKPDGNALKQAVLVSVPLLAPAVLLLSIPALFLALVLAIGAAFFVGYIAEKKIGGVTGDVLGAIQQICGLGFLTGMLMVP